MISALIIIAQIAGPIISAAIWFNQTHPAIVAYRAGAVSATLDGFYGPVALQVLGMVAGLLLPYVAPKWRPILAWIKSILPDSSAGDPQSVISKTLADALASERAAANQRLQEAEQQILEELQAALAKSTGKVSSRKG